ncbi:beta strand repeat-containing protein [Paludibaculum fermentans]|uniref:beta strand repeat-containing protein n=1 Tax=Paludibaculum fermentans TaxID=1473598 RepID=UPI003EB7D8F1
MANRFWVGSTGTWDATAGTKWSATSGGSGGASVPTASDDVFLDGSSGAGTVTLSASSVCRDLTCTGFTGTLSHPAATSLVISGSLTMAAGMTYSLGSASTSSVSFNATSTGKTFTSAGKVFGNMTFLGTGGWTLQDDLLVTGGSITLTAGTFDTNNRSVTASGFASNNSNTRTLSLGSSAIALTGTSPWSTATNNNLTVSTNTATVTCSASGANIVCGSSKNWNGLSLVITGSASPGLNAPGCTFANITRTGTAAKTDGFTLTGDITVTGTLTLTGNSVLNRLFVSSSATGSTRTITNTGATMAWSNVDLQDIALTTAYDASAITGLCGDVGGNSNITFTTPATQTWSGTASGTWSSNAWTSRVPLPQDNVVVASAFTPAGRVITVDVPRMGANVDFTGTTGTPALTFTAGVISCVNGSLTLVSAMSVANINTTLQFYGRGSYNLTTAGLQISPTVTLNAPGGTLSLQDALSCGRSLNVNSGTFTTNDYSVLVLTAMNIASSGAAICNLGASTVTLSGTGTIWNAQSNGILNAGTSNIVLSNTTTTAKSFTNSGVKTYSTVTFSGDNITVNNANTCTIGTLAVSNAGLTNGLKLTSGQTIAVANVTSNGSAGSLAKLSTTTAGTAATLTSSASQIAEDYMSLQDIAAAGTAAWYAGSHSTDVSGNTGWLWSDPASGTTIAIAGALTGSSNFTGSLSRRALLGAALAGNGSLASSLARRAILAASLAGSGTLAGTLLKRIKLASNLAGSGTMAGTLTRRALLAANLSGSGSLAGTLIRRILIAASLSGTSTLTGALYGAGGTIIPIAGALTGTSSMTGVLVRRQLFSAALAGTSGMTGTLITRKHLAAALMAQGSLIGSLAGVQVITRVRAMSPVIGAPKQVSNTITNTRPVSRD